MRWGIQLVCATPDSLAGNICVQQVYTCVVDAGNHVAYHVHTFGLCLQIYSQRSRTAISETVSTGRPCPVCSLQRAHS